MFTQCPHCETRFRIRALEIRAAGGKVHCGHCNNIFNAIEMLYDNAAQSNAEPLPAAEADTEGDSWRDIATTSSPNAVAPQGTTGIQDELPVSAEDPQRSARDLPFEVPDNLPEIQPAAVSRGSGLPGSNSVRGKDRPLFWGVLVFTLLLLALAQLTWQKRELILQDPQGRAVLAPICEILGCEIPYRSAPERVVILARSIATHPEKEGALRVVLTFANEADFPQKYPDIQLSFFDVNESLVARRRFEPQVYLGNPAPLPTHLDPGERVDITMDLDDPGEEVTGFKFDFL